MGANGSKSFSFTDCGARDSDDSDSGLPICGGRGNPDGAIGSSSAGFSFGSSSAGNFTPRSGIGSSSSMTPRTAERASIGPGQRAQRGSRNSPRYSAAPGTSGGLMVEMGDGSSREVAAEAGKETSRRAERRKMSVEEYYGAVSPRNARGSSTHGRKQSPGKSPRGRSSRGGRRNYLPPKNENGKFAALASNVDAHDEPLYTLPEDDEGGGRRGSLLGGKIADAAEAAAKKIADTAKESGGKIFGAVMGLFTKEEASILTKEEKKQLKANFDMIDVDGGGSIGRDEFKAAMMVALVKHPDKPPIPDDEALQKEFDKYDADGDGSIDLEEFYEVFAAIKRDVKKNFEEIDKDGSGELDREEFKAAMELAFAKHPDKPPMPDDETLQKEFDNCDIDGNGTIELDEFYTCFANLKAVIGNQEARDKFAVAAIPSYLPEVKESWSNNGRWMINGRGGSYVQGVADNVKAKEKWDARS